MRSAHDLPSAALFCTTTCPLDVGRRDDIAGSASGTHLLSQSRFFIEKCAGGEGLRVWCERQQKQALARYNKWDGNVGVP
jgi:hypothetical protein